MIKIRTIEEEIARRYPENQMRCPIHLSIGQEAVPSVLSELTSSKDLVVSTHRSHAHYIAKGGSTKKMICEIYGKENGCSKGRGGSMHLTDMDAGFVCSTAIVGNTIPIGVGLSYHIKSRELENIVCIYIGDGATEEGVFYESINFAAVHKLPCLFICENNFYSVYTSLIDRQPKNRQIHEMVRSMGIEAYKCNGNDICDIYNTMQPIIGKMRAGEGPVFLECETYRWREHCGPNYDDNLNYRDKSEREEWIGKDPIKIASKWVGENSREIIDLKSMAIPIEKELENIFNIAINADFPPFNSLLDNVYHTSKREG